MKVYGLWYGGANYTGSSYKYLEVFDSIEYLKEEFYDRYHCSKGYFQYAAESDDTGPSGGTGTPCVTKEQEIWVWFEKPEDNGDLYPDKILSFGPKMGIRLETA